MALVTAYLARTAQLGAGRMAAAAAFNVFTRMVKAWRLTRQAFAEAEELRRVTAKRYPHLDI